MITQHGRERATLIGTQEYQELSKKARAFERSGRKATRFRLEGSLEMCCSPEELIEEMRKIRAIWTESIHRSSAELARELARE